MNISYCAAPSVSSRSGSGQAYKRGLIHCRSARLDGWDQLNAEEAQSRAAIVFGRWLTLVRGLVGSQRIGEHRVPFGPTDEVVVKAALQQLTGYRQGYSRMREVTIPQLWQLLDDPTDDLVTQCRYESRRHFLDETRMLRDALGQLVSGALAGLFDDHSTIDVDWRAPIQSLSLSRLEPLGDEAVGIALLCLNSWGRGMRELADPGDRRIVVRDESWKQLRLGVEAVKSFDADLRLSRSNGDIQVAVGHKPSDPLSAGDVGSQAVAIAKDLLHLADIKVLHGQDLAVAEELDRLLGLGPIAQDLVTGWAMHGKGRALWCVGEQLYKVQTVLHPAEQPSPTPTTPSKPPAEASVKKLLLLAALSGGDHLRPACCRGRRGEHLGARRGQRHRLRRRRSGSCDRGVAAAVSAALCPHLCLRASFPSHI